MKRIILASLLTSLTVLVMPVRITANELESTARRVSSARIFTSPIEWTGELAPAEKESLALEQALGAFNEEGVKEGYVAVEDFLRSEPGSKWAPSLHMHLAERYRVMGRYSAANGHWEKSWQLTKNSADPVSKKIAARALSGWLGLLGSLGRKEQMDTLVTESHQLGMLDTPYSSAIRSSMEGLTVMKSRPGDAFRCGSLALSAVMKTVDQKQLTWKTVQDAPSPTGGFNLSQLVELAASNRFPVIAVQRETGSIIPVPSVVHWKLDHYAAIVEVNDGRYKVVDPTFGTLNWLDAATVNEEASGFFLVPDTNNATGLRRLGRKEASLVHGKGYTKGTDDDDDNPGDDDDDDDCDPPDANDGPEGGGEPCPSDAGMPIWSISDPFMTLWIHDTPLYYRNARGGWEKLRLSYKHRTVPRNDTVAGFGDGWECNWIGFLEQDTASPATIKNYLAGGGIIKFATNGTHEYHSSRKLIMNAGAPEKIISPGATMGGAGGSSVSASSARGGIGASQSSDGRGGDLRQVVPSSLRKPVGGSENRYGASISYGAGITRYFRTNQQDRYQRTKSYQFASTNISSTTYYRLTNRVDKDGRSSTLAYTNASFPRLITSVTDPYGRSAHFIYNQDGKLTNIIDMAGISTSFRYHSDGSITNMVTPYGTNSFRYYSKAGGSGNWARGLEVSEPIGTKQLSTYHDGPLQPHHLYSYHWNRAQYAAISSGGKSDPMNGMSDADLGLAPRKQWMRTAVDAGVANLNGTLLTQWDPEDPQNDNERNNVVSYYYPSQNYNVIGTMKRPNDIFWSDSTEAYPRDETMIQRNTWGRPTAIIYWLKGASVSYINTYDTDGRRLLEVTGPNSERIRGYGYDATRTNLLTSVTNALNEVIRYTYDSAARVTSITQPGGLVTSNIYYSSGAQSGFLLTRMDLGFRTNHFTWLNGNLEWHTNELGLATRQIWDSLNRVISTVYPDGTTVSNVYNTLDLIASKDRLNQWTYYGYNRVHQMVAQTNVSGQVTEWDYCGCGSPSEVTVWNGAASQVTSYYYNMAGRVTNVVHPDGHSLSYVYDRGGRLSKVIEPGGRQTTLTYADQNQLKDVFVENVNTSESGYVLSQDYDIYGRLTRITNRNRIIVTNGYDVLGRLTVRATLDANGNLSNTVSTTYTTVGVTNTTDELGRQTWFVHDAAGRILFQTNANNEVLKFTYNAADQMLSFKDGRNKETKWNYDEYGRVTNKLDATATAIFRYKYDPLNRLTNRWTPAKGDTFYRYDSLGNLTNVDYTGSSFDLSFQYDGLSRLTNVVDAVGNTRFGYNSVGQLTSEDGPWGGDVVSYTYNNRLRSGLSLSRPSSSPWSVDYVYDGLQRLTNVVSAAGGFIHKYRSISSGLSDQLAALGLGGTTHYTHTNYVEYDYDALARLTATRLLNSSGGILNQHGYQLNEAGQRTRQTVDWGDFYGSNRRWDYTYDNVGQLKSAKGTDRTWDHTYWTYNDTSRSHEQFGYGYDAAGNLQWRTNNALVQSYSVDDNNQLTSGTRSGTLTVSGWANQNRGGDESWGSPAGVTNVTVSGTGLSTGSAALYIDGSWALAGATLANGNNSYTATARDTSERTATDSLTVNLPTTVTFQYDGNGNLTNDGRRAFGYDYENQLTDVTVTGEWRSEFQYDAFGRRRLRREYTWRGSQWGLTNEVRYVYDGMLVVEERDGLNVPRVSYTRGNDLSGSLEGAGGIGGLLARTDYLSAKPVTSFYHSDGNGNVTALASGLGKIAARYHYDPYGNLLGKFGQMAELNLYRFSSKEHHASSGLYYYGYRYYEPNLQRWMNTDPIMEEGGINLFQFAFNRPTDLFDSDGRVVPIIVAIAIVYFAYEANANAPNPGDKLYGPYEGAPHPLDVARLCLNPSGTIMGVVREEVGIGSGGKGRGNPGERRQQGKKPPSKKHQNEHNQTGKQKTKDKDEEEPTKTAKKEDKSNPWWFHENKTNPNELPKDYCPAPIRSGR